MTIFVDRLEIAAWIGVHHHERGQTQPLTISVEMTVETPDVDRIEATVDYGIVVVAVDTVLASGHIETVEHVAREVGRLLLAEPRVRRVRVRIDKPRAIAGAASAGAIWTQRR